MPRLHSIGGAVRAMLDGADKFAAVQAGAHGAATSPWNRLRQPSAAELKAGTYPAGRATWQGLAIMVENPAHTIREGVDDDGAPWRNVMLAHYGFFEGTRGADGDGIDVFLGPAPESEAVWILNQRNAAGGFDEHKVLAGFVDARQAVDAYRLSYSNAWDRYGPPIPVSIAQLRWWLKFSDTTREFSLALVPPEPDMNESTKPPLQRVFWDSAAEPTMGRTLASVLYELRVHDGSDGLLLDPMSMADVTEGAEVVALDALVTEAGKLKPKMTALLRVMEAAGGEVKPLAVQFSDLLRRFGGVHVAALFELSDGQTITAWFHNPDSTPNKFSPGDMLVSWKWQLNKKDVTIAVAPESGQDLNLREVARRLMRLAAKNSAAFAKANAKRAGVMAEIAGLRETLASEQAVLADLHQQIEVATGERDARIAAREAKDPARNWISGDGLRNLCEGRGITVESVDDEDDVLVATLSVKAVRATLQSKFARSWQITAIGDLAGTFDVSEEVLSEGLNRLQIFADAVEMKARDPIKRGREDFAAGKPYEVPEDITNVGDRADWKRGWQFAKNADDEAKRPALPDWQEWLGDLYRRIEEAYGTTTSDAQGVADARESEVRAAYEAGQTVEQVGVMLMGEPGDGGNDANPEPDPAPSNDGARTVRLPGGLTKAQGYVLFLVNGLKSAFRRKNAKAQGGMSEDEFDAAVTGLKRMGALTTNGGLAPTGESLVKKIKLASFPDEDPKGLMSDRILSQFYGRFGEPTVGNYGVKRVINYVGAEDPEEGVSSGGGTQTEPDPAPASADAAMLRDVLAGKHDTMALDLLLQKIEDAVKKLDADGLLQGAIDADATAAITHWVKLDELANG